MLHSHSTRCCSGRYLFHNVLGLADRRVAVTADNGVEWPTDVDVILLPTGGVGQVHHHPVVASARQTEGRSEAPE